jgi:hypothetical protein
MEVATNGSVFAPLRTPTALSVKPGAGSVEYPKKCKWSLAWEKRISCVWLMILGGFLRLLTIAAPKSKLYSVKRKRRIVVYRGVSSQAISIASREFDND